MSSALNVQAEVRQGKCLDTCDGLCDAHYYK